MGLLGVARVENLFVRSNVDFFFLVFQFSLFLQPFHSITFLQGHPLVRVADTRFLSHVATCLVLNRTVARPLRPATWAGPGARRHDGPHRLCPLPVREAHQAEMRTNLGDSQIEETTRNVDGADTADLASLVADLPGTPDPVFMVLDHDGLHESTAHPDPSFRWHSKIKRETPVFAVTGHLQTDF